MRQGVLRSGARRALPRQGGCIRQPPRKCQRACETAAKAPKKPCFLKVWIHDWKNGHGSDAEVARKAAAPCCQSCKCCGGGTPVAASPQGGVASAQGATAQTGLAH